MTDREIDHLVWLAMQYEGSLLPVTVETVAYWEEKLKDEPPIPPDVMKRMDERFRKLLAEKFKCPERDSNS